MEEKIIKIQAPEGYEIDKENSTFERIVFKEKEVETYNDVAEKLFKHKYGYYLNDDGEARNIRFGSSFNKPNDATTEGQLEWLMALNKLKNVATYLNDGWVPNWEDDDENKNYLWYRPETDSITVHCFTFVCISGVVFKTGKLAEKAIKILGKETVKTALGVYIKN